MKDSGDDWRKRLREACNRSRKNHGVIARDAGVKRETLSRVLNNRMTRPSFDVVTRLARSAGVTVGWLLSERGFHLSEDRRTRLRQAAEVLDEILRDT